MQITSTTKVKPLPDLFFFFFFEINILNCQFKCCFCFGNIIWQSRSIPIKMKMRKYSLWLADANLLASLHYVRLASHSWNCARLLGPATQSRRQLWLWITQNDPKTWNMNKNLSWLIYFSAIEIIFKKSPGTHVLTNSASIQLTFYCTANAKMLTVFI